MTSVVVRAFTMLLAGSLVVTASGSSSAIHARDSWTEARFRTGCEPGPFHEPPPPEHLETRFPPLGTEPNSALVRVDLGELSPAAPRPILGTGFNLEHALWSCPEFRGLLRSEVLDAFQPAIARVDTGLSSAPYAQSWSFFHQLNRAGVRIVLGVWGGPAQFTDDGTRLGLLLPTHYDDYVEYVASVSRRSSWSTRTLCRSTSVSS